MFEIIIASYYYCYNFYYYYCRFYTITGRDLASDTRLQRNVDWPNFVGRAKKAEDGNLI